MSLGNAFFRRNRSRRANKALDRSLFTKKERESTRIDSRQSRNSKTLECIREIFFRTPVRCRIDLLNEQTSRLEFDAFHIGLIHTDVSDFRFGESDKLSRIGWVGENFFVTRKRSVKHHFTKGVYGSAHRVTVKNATVSQCEERFAFTLQFPFFL